MVSKIRENIRYILLMLVLLFIIGVGIQILYEETIYDRVEHTPYGKMCFMESNIPMNEQMISNPDYKVLIYGYEPVDCHMFWNSKVIYDE